MKEEKLFNLQLFAEESTEETDDVQDTDQVEETHEEQPEEKMVPASEIAKIVEQRLARERKAAEKREQEAARLAGMNEKERADEEFKQLQEELAELKRDKSINAMTKVANKMITKAKIPLKDSIVKGLVRDTAEETKESVNEFIELVSEIKNELLKDKFTGKSPKVQTTSQPKEKMTKAEIMAVRDDAKRQKLMEEHIHLFTK